MAIRCGVWAAVSLASAVLAGAETDETWERGGGRRRGDVALSLTFNVTPSDEWEPGPAVLLYADARRNPEINQEDIFHAERFPGVYPRTPEQRFDFTLPDVRVGEKILVQGYMCAEGTTDCYPSDSDNPPSCAAEVRILDRLRPSCQPVFTWTGGEGAGGVLCSAECR